MSLRKLLVVLLVAFVLALAFNASCRRADAQLVLVGSDTEAFGTGCCVGRNVDGHALVLTAAHCCCEPVEYRVISHQNRWPARVVVKSDMTPNRRDWVADVALLSAQDGGVLKVQPLGSQAGIEEPVCINGFPQADMRNLRQRTVRIIAVATDSLTLSQPSVGGESGGPICNRRGEVVGVLSSTSARDTICTDVNAIRRICGQHLGGKTKTLKSVELWHFTAPWCGPCQLMDPVVVKLRTAGMPIIDKDFDRERRLAHSVGVYSIPAFVVMKDGKPVEKICMMTTEGAIRRMYERHAVVKADCARPEPEAPAPPPEEPAPVPIPDPISTPPAKPEGPPPAVPAQCDCGPRFDAIIARLTALENKPGPVGRSGKDGTNGNPGRDGKDGAFIATAQIRNGHLILIRSDGKEIDAGALPTSDNSALSQRVAALEKQVEKPFDVQLFVNGQPTTDVRSVQPHGGWLPIDLPWEVVKPQEK